MLQKLQKRKDSNFNTSLTAELVVGHVEPRYTVESAELSGDRTCVDIEVVRVAVRCLRF